MNDLDYAVMEFMRENPLTATYHKASRGEYDPTTGEVPSTVVEIPVQAILMDLTLQSNGLSTKYETLIEAGDKELYVRPPHKTDPLNPQLDIVPADDRVEVDGVIYKIVTFKEVNPTGADALLYSLYIRR